MKKLITSALIITVLLSLFGCSSSGSDNDAIMLTDEELLKYFRKIELTTDNWQDYLQFVERRVELTDEFGDTYGYKTLFDLAPKDWCLIRVFNEERPVVKINLVYDRSTGSSPDDITSTDNNMEYEVTSDILTNMNLLSNSPNYFAFVCEENDTKDKTYTYSKIQSADVEKIKGFVYVLDAPADNLRHDEKGDYFEVCLKNHKKLVVRYYQTGELVLMSDTKEFEEYKIIVWSGMAQLDEFNYSLLSEVPDVTNQP